jgi:SAM-dependent methyltransferase
LSGWRGLVKKNRLARLDLAFTAAGKMQNLDRLDSRNQMNFASQNAGMPRSPLSASPPEKIRDLPRAFILEQLEIYYGAKPPSDAVECDYSLWECSETGLQFAWPMLPGNACFYKWASGFASYYPGIRWEYGEVRRLLESEKTAAGKNFNLLDAGCGGGDFLQSLNSISNENKFALDLNAPAIEKCRQKGFQAFCGTVDSALAAGFLKAGEFPVVTAFHCLEHVDDPVNFVRSLVKLAAPVGRVFISTPYSPMSFEDDWFDILNHPPHHLTRWNLRAYQRLAETAGAKMRCFVPPSSALKRALNVFRLRQYGPNHPVGKGKLLADLLRHFPALMRDFRKQKSRGPIAADVILVELTVS